MAPTEEREIERALKCIPGLLSRVEETYENTIKIIQALHGEIGTQDTGILGRMERMDIRTARIETDVTNHVAHHAATQDALRNRAWDVVLRLLPWILSGGLGGVLAWRIGL